MARWDEDGRWGEGDERRGSRRGDEWRGAGRLAGRGPGGRDRWGEEEPRRGDEEGSDRDRWRRDVGRGWPGALGASGRDVPTYGGPYRRGDDYGARECGASG